MSYPKHIIHQSTSSRPNLDELNTLFWPTLTDPFCNEPDAKQLTKNLRDLGRCDKVSRRAELVSSLSNSSSVVAAQITSKAHSHVASQRNRASYLNRELEYILGYEGDRNLLKLLQITA